MLVMDIIGSAQTKWASRMVFVPKKDGMFPFCLEYRKLKAVTIPNPYPISGMDWCIDSLGYAKIFSTLDAYSRYWQVDIAEYDREKIAVTSLHRFWGFKNLSSGLENASVTFQRAIDVLLTKVKMAVCLDLLRWYFYISANAKRTHI